jgi:hypothetical protein
MHVVLLHCLTHGFVWSVSSHVLPLIVPLQRKACGEEASQLQAQVSQLQQLMQASSAQQQQLEQQLGQAAHREAVNQQLVQDLKRQLAAETAQHQAASQRLQQREGEHQATASQVSPSSCTSSQFQLAVHWIAVGKLIVVSGVPGASGQ